MDPILSYRTVRPLLLIRITVIDVRYERIGKRIKRSYTITNDFDKTRDDRRTVRERCDE